MSSVPSASDQPLQVMLRTFEEAYRAQVPFREDGALGEDLASEVKPVLEALAEVAAAPEPHPQLHEAYALLTLLAHRAGLLGATPSAAMGLASAIVASLQAGGVPVSPAFQRELGMVVVEGYSQGRDERVTRELKQAARAGQVCVRLAPGCHAAFLSGPLEPEALEEVLDGLARELLRDDARSCLLDVSRLTSEPESAARLVINFAHMARSLGARVLVCAKPGSLVSELERLGLSDGGAELASDFESSLHAALHAAGCALTTRRRRWNLLARRRERPPSKA